MRVMREVIRGVGFKIDFVGVIIGPDIEMIVLKISILCVHPICLTVT